MNQQRISSPVGLVILAFILACLAGVSQGKLESNERRLSFYHTHTGNHLDVVYFRNGVYIPSALEEINRLLYDFRTGENAEMDPELRDLIYDVRTALGSDGS